MLAEKIYFFKELGFSSLFRSNFENKKISDIAYFNSKLKPYVDDSNILFIHVPKAAGTSLVKSIYKRHDWCHLTYQDYEKIFDGLIFNSFFKFSFVRNPYSRFISSYNYLKRSNLFFDKIWTNSNIGDKSISEILAIFNDIDDVDKLAIDHFRRQSYFLNGPVDFLGRQESFNDDLVKLSALIGKDITNIRENVSDDVNKEPLCSKDKAIIEKIYHADFELYETVK